MKMKKLHVFQLMLSSALLIMSSCGGTGKMVKEAGTIGYEVSPSPLEMKGDSVEVSITAKYPPKFFNKNAVVVVVPTIQWEGGSVSYDKVTLQGEKVQGNAETIAFETGGTVTYTGKVAYEEGMLQSKLVLKSSASVKGKEAVALPEKEIADGVLATASLLENDALPIEITNQFKRRQVISAESQINFLVNQSAVRSKELKDADIVAMKEFIKAAKADDAIEMKNAKIIAAASPDGSEAINEKIADGRQKSAEKFVSKEVETEILGTYITEDWDGFRQLMQASDIENKEVILSVLQKYSDVVAREAEIKKMSVVYKQIAEEVLPELRRSKIILNAEKMGKSDSLLLAMSTADVTEDTLTIEEYLFASTVGTQEQAIVILKNAAQVYPECWRAYNNLGVVYAEQDKLTEALAAFNKADELSDGDKAVKNNLGVVSVKQGDLVKGLEYFEIAQGAGSEVKYNMGVIKVKEGDYSSAVSLFGSNSTFNAALAKLLNGDVDGALQTITKAGEDENALAYYLKAIIGARQKNADMIVSNLKVAIEKDPTLRERAKKDLEFKNFADDSNFQSVIR